MAYQVQWLGLVIAYLLGYWLWGYVFTNIMKMKKNSISSTIVTGFFAYYSVFQTIALPMILSKKSLTSLSRCWLVVNVIMLVLVVGIVIRRLVKKKKVYDFGQAFQLKGDWLVIVAIVFVAVLAYYVALQLYKGWDSAYYMGTLSTTMYTDTMYIYDGNSGFKCDVINMRYAMSTFYMHTAVVARLTGISAVMIQRFVVASLCAILNGLVVYCIGKIVFDGNRQRAAGLTILTEILSAYLMSYYSTSEFMFLRGYEAKGYCANVVLPAVIYCILGIWKQREEVIDYWKQLFFVSLASVAVSMSAILIVPVMVVIMLLAHIIVVKEWKGIWYGILCALPNAVYLVMYFLFAKGLIVIGV